VTTTDQRGFTRVVVGEVDLGAFEVQTTDSAVALTTSSSSSVYGQAVTLTATVNLTVSGTKATAGTVTFFDGSTVLASNVPVNASGRATFSTSGLTAGTHSLVAKYSSPTGTLSTSSALSQVVNPLAVKLSGSRPYDGTTAAAAGILSIANLVGSDKVTLSGTATLAGTGAGPVAISSVAGLQLGGSAAANYTVTGASGSVTIIVGPLTVVDAGFEHPNAGPAGAWRSFIYDPTGTAWSFAGAAGVAANGSGFTSGNPPAPEGAQVAFLQETGSFSQRVADWAAGSYVITFDAAQRGGGSHQNFEVLVDGTVVGTFKPTGTSYQTYTTAAFTVTAGADTIEFLGLNTAGGDNTAFIDAVSVVTL
jgi:hypothetical protein